MRMIVICSLGRDRCVACRNIRMKRLSSVKQAHDPVMIWFMVKKS